MLDQLARVGGDSGAPARRAQPRDGFGIFVRDIFAAIEFNKVFARSDDERSLGDGEDGRALR